MYCHSYQGVLSINYVLSCSMFVKTILVLDFCFRSIFLLFLGHLMLKLHTRMHSVIFLCNGLSLPLADIIFFGLFLLGFPPRF